MCLASDSADLVQKFIKTRENDDLESSEMSRLWVETRETITELFLQENWKLSDRIIQEEVQKALGPLDLPSEDRLKPHFEEVIEDLRSETTYTAYIYFPELVEMPIGKEIGDLVVIEEPAEKEDLLEYMSNMFAKNEHFVNLYEGRTWGKLEFSSFKRRAYIREELFNQLQPILGALNVSTGRAPPPEDLAGGIYNPEGYIWFLEPSQEPSGWTRYDERFAEPTLTKLSDVLQNNEGDRTPLESNILGSIRLLTLHSHNYRDEHSFLTLVAALEGLLLDKYERPKADRMAEKTVQLLWPDSDVETKIEHYDRIKGWYHTRSGIIHGGYQKVTREEVRGVEKTVEHVVRELVKLTDDYYSLQKQGGENNTYTGLNEMFLEQRLRTSFEEE